MPTIVFVQADGVREAHVGEPGRSVMDCALDNGVRGIRAQCGGGCTCSTCHGFVDEAWFHLVGPPLGDEADILEYVPGRRDTSRLTCQIPIRDELDGVVIHVPPPE
ncbi:MAG: 2Fe-2S iron-sulfur cluster binding domain-containing protein [Gammaproteobacteria bacterium]|nr:2Fe-2S iron-sulfur cluster binding domain-containing protein [Gammaproteobacteria bacterium]